MMTAIDVTIIALVLWALWQLRRLHSKLREHKFGSGSRRVAIGLSLIGLFYIADLALMWIMPHIENPAVAMQQMSWLHLNLAWVLMLCVIALVATGFVRNIRRLMSHALQAQDSARRYQELLASQRSALSQLRDSQTRLKTILETAFEGILRIDDHGTVLNVNAAIVTMFGYSEAELVGSNVKRLMPSPHHEKHDGYLENYRRGGVARIIGKGRDVRGRRKDGSEFPLHLAVTEYDLDDRRFFTGFITDLSDRVRMERQLRQAQKREALGRLAAGVAHEFNNMLTVILAYAQKLESRALDAGEPSTELTQIREAAQRSITFVGELLNYSRSSAPDVKSTDLNRLISEADTMLRPLLDANVQLQTVLAGGLGTVRVNPDQIKQALVNLVINARDAMPDGGCVTVETANIRLDKNYADVHVDATPGNYVLLAVSDTGTGMDEVTREQAFEPFFSTKSGGHRVGLGLSTVQGIVRQNGGSLGVYSEPGRGSTFKIYLPRVAGKPAPTGDPQPAGDERVGGTESILIVDDEVMIREVARDMLENAGYQCVLAADGLEALEVLASSPAHIDLVLTDLVMPGVGGVELAEKIAERYPDTPVICLTGYTENGLIGHAMESHCRTALQKPFTVRDLLRTVRGVLDVAGSAPKDGSE